MWLFYISFTLVKRIVYFIQKFENLKIDENVNNTTEETALLAWPLCESYEYSVSSDHCCWPHGSHLV